MPSVYTRRGDEGLTSLASGERVPKTHPRIEAYGTVDELNSFIGLLLSLLEKSHKESARLTTIQQILFDISALLATEEETAKKYHLRGVTEEAVEDLEKAIDAINEILGPWRGFVLPAGSQAACTAHVCRTVCRRTERQILALQPEIKVDPNVLRFVNRLSDYLFVLARIINHNDGVEETMWKK